MNKAMIGIDPGKGGGIAVITDDSVFTSAFNDDSIGVTIADCISGCDTPHVFAVIESVHSFPGQGVSSTFTFGKAFGEALGALDALRIPYRLIQPQAWQKLIAGIPKKKDGATAHKRALKIEAQRRFPQCKPTNKTCDALLIADYGRQTFK